MDNPIAGPSFRSTVLYWVENYLLSEVELAKKRLIDRNRVRKTQGSKNIQLFVLLIAVC